MTRPLRRVLRRSPGVAPGPGWFIVKSDGKKVVKLGCPDCHHVGTLDHEVRADGTVWPSVVCQVKGCGFHEYIKLEDFSLELLEAR